MILLPMNAPLKIVSIACCALAAAVGQAQTVPSRIAERLAHGESLHVVVYGTSLTAGGDWVPQLVRALQKRYPGQLRLTNAAGSGKNSDWGVENLESHVIDKHPNAVFIEFAVNDSVERFHLSRRESRSNLNNMIRRIRKANPATEIILQTTNPVIDRPKGDSGYRPNLEDYFEVMRRVAFDKHTVLVDQETAWKRVLDRGASVFHRFVPDGLHPNAAGCAEVATPALLAGLGVPEADAYFQSTQQAFDVLVYGGTSAAVTAAVQARRMGKTVLLVSPDRHIGGLSINGLGWTDAGDIRTIGGLSRDFYHRVYNYYSRPEAWNWQPQNTFGGSAQNSKARDDKTQTMWTFEPHVAESIFRDLLGENEIPVVYNRLSRDRGVYKRGTQIVGIRTEAGFNYAARTFIDATYEGDLMAGAGVSFTTGRETNSQYGETFNGIQKTRAVANQLPKGISPYRREGHPGSGLLPGVEPASNDPDGSADGRIQAYCYRMVLTNEPGNTIPIAKPEGYREGDYELVFRAIAAGQKSQFFKFDPVPNRKTDSNNDGGISTDFIGQNYAYPNAGYDERLTISQAHEKWQRGLIWTLQNSKRVPAKIRKRYLGWGLPKDEFVDHNNWPFGLYVREARRMIGETVITENSIRNKTGAARSIGMGSYNMDSHNVRRLVGPNGNLMDEGDVQKAPNGPYPIDYGAIIPKASECTNLYVPVCVSSTHIAFGSIRMEPVFMILGQSAATAAAISLDGIVSAQDVSYARLMQQLLKDGQTLSLPKSSQ